MLHRSSSSLGLVALAALVSACGSSSPDDRPVIAQNVYVLPTDVVAKATLSPDQIAFDGSAADAVRGRKSGDIIVSDRNSSVGFFRKVASVTESSTGIVIGTTEALLTDAVKEGTIEIKRDLLEPDPSDSIDPGLQPMDLGGLLGGHWNLTGLVFGARDAALGGQIDIEPTGYIDFHPMLDVQVLVGHGEVKHFHAIASGRLDAGLGVKINARGFFSTNAKFEFKPKEVAAIEHRFFEMVGILPLEEKVKFGIYYGCYVGLGGEVQASAEGDAVDTVRFGTQYDSGSWTPVASQQIDVHIDGSISGHTTAFAKCFIQARVDLAFYESVGPAFWVQPYLQPEIFPTPAPGTWDLKLGVDGYAGAKFSFLGFKDIAEAKFQLFDWNQVIGRGDLPVAPSGSGGAPSSTGGASAMSGGATGSGGSSGSGGSLSSGGSGGGSSVDPCTVTTYGGLYCGQSTQNGFTNGIPDHLYDCENRTAASDTFCPYGCNVAPPGQNDGCNAAPASDPCAHVQYGGFYCGQSTQSGFATGDTDYLYDCENNATSTKQYCPTGCYVAAPGQNDHCNTADCTTVTCGTNFVCKSNACVCEGTLCGNICCAATDFCGGAYRTKCCDGITCSPGCPC